MSPEVMIPRSDLKLEERLAIVKALRRWGKKFKARALKLEPKRKFEPFHAFTVIRVGWRTRFSKHLKQSSAEELWRLGCGCENHANALAEETSKGEQR